MPDTPFKLGHYTVERELGRGGMGVVYVGRDTRLDRAVAIKVLADNLADEAAFLARFRQEAQILAQLNATQIATVYGIEELEGRSYLVMEFVDGESLGARLQRGAMSIEEALRITSAIAAGVARAHDEGIVHRDLKPGNVMISRQGEVKVLDFGIARRDSDATTDNAEPLTTPGMVVGSPGYMSPEQAVGDDVDKRADVFSFGCLLYECLTGKRVFSGTTYAEAVAAVVMEEPDWDRLPPTTPARVRELLARCLRKNAADRLRDLGDAKLELDEALQGREWVDMSARRRRRWLPWIAAAGAAIAGAWLAATLVEPGSAGDASSGEVTCLEVAPPPGYRLRLFTPSVRLSPGARHLAYYVQGEHGGTTTLIRSLDRFSSEPVRVDGGLFEPIFSGDDGWVAGTSGGKIIKLRVGQPTTREVISAAQVNYGMCWLDSDWIVFAGALGSGLEKVPASGEAGGRVTTVDKARGEQLHMGPQRGWADDDFVFFVGSGSDMEQNEIAIGNLDGGPHRVLTKGKTAFAIRPDLLVVCRDHLLYGARVDLERSRLLHEPVLIPDITVRYGQVALPQVWVTTKGHLAYVEGVATGSPVRIAVVDRQGGVTDCPVPAAATSPMEFSPDGTRVVFGGMVGSSQELFTWDWRRAVVDAVTANTLAYESHASWSADGQRLRYHTHERGQHGIYSRSASGMGEAEKLASIDPRLRPTSWLRDGNGFAAVGPTSTSGSSRDIWIVRKQDDEWVAHPFLDGVADESSAAISPDGRFIAYVSDHTGRSEVYVVPYPAKNERWPISRLGGMAPRWSEQGELFFMRNGEVWSVPYSAEPEFAAGTPKMVLSGHELLGTPVQNQFAVSPDGQRFVLIAAAEETPERDPSVIRVVLHWVETWRRLLPPR